MTIQKIDLIEDFKSNMPSAEKISPGMNNDADMMSIYASDIALENDRDLKKLRNSLLRKIPQDMRDMDRTLTAGFDHNTANRSFEEITNENSFDRYAKSKGSLGDFSSLSLNKKSVLLNQQRQDIFSNKPQTRQSEGTHYGLDLLCVPTRVLA
jgi:hypothetical protein